MIRAAPQNVKRRTDLHGAGVGLFAALRCALGSRRRRVTVIDTATCDNDWGKWPDDINAELDTWQARGATRAFITIGWHNDLVDRVHRIADAVER